MVYCFLGPDWEQGTAGAGKKSYTNKLLNGTAGHSGTPYDATAAMEPPVCLQDIASYFEGLFSNQNHTCFPGIEYRCPQETS